MQYSNPQNDRFRQRLAKRQQHTDAMRKRMEEQRRRQAPMRTAAALAPVAGGLLGTGVGALGGYLAGGGGVTGLMTAGTGAQAGAQVGSQLGMLGGQGANVLADQAVEEDEVEVARRNAEIQSILQLLLSA